MGARTFRIFATMAGVTAGLALAVPMSATAQVTTTLPAVQRCLCAQRAVTAFGREMRMSQRRERQARGRADALNQQVEAARARVNTDNRSDIEAFSALLQQRDSASDVYHREGQHYADLVSRYNDAVEEDNASCSGRLFDPEEVASLQGRLSCPRP
jgi:anthranilate/para-aminobenzoate synthase component II